MIGIGLRAKQQAQGVILSFGGAALKRGPPSLVFGVDLRMLLEEHRHGRSSAWYWGQVLTAIVVAQSQAALLVIGDEILSGRTKDRNIGTVAEHLTGIGIATRRHATRI